MTVNLNLSDPLIDAAVAKLQTEMPTRVATINASVTDGVTINPPAAYLPDGLNEIPSTATPALIVLEGRTPKFEWEGTHGFITPTQIIVVIVEEDVDRAVLARKLRRQARAVVESLWDGSPQEMLAAPAADGTRIRPFSIDPGPAGRATQSNIAWRATYVVTFLARQLEGL